MAKKIPFFSADLNGNGKVGFFESIAGADPLIRAAGGLFRNWTGRNQTPGSTWGANDRNWGGLPQRQQFGTTQGYPWQVNDFSQGINYNSGGINQQGSLARLINPQTTVNDLQNNINYDSGGINPNYGQTIGTTMPKPRPVQYPTRNGLDFMNTAGTGYQSLNKPLYQPNAMQVNNGYFDMGKANTVGGNWVNGAGWRTDANRAMGQTEEDMAFNAQMAQRLGTMAQ